MQTDGSDDRNALDASQEGTSNGHRRHDTHTKRTMGTRRQVRDVHLVLAQSMQRMPIQTKGEDEETMTWICQQCNEVITEENFWRHKHHAYKDDGKP